MNLGFLGVQLGWGLQIANISSLLAYLGASIHQLPLLWLAAPVTGLILQPLVGYLSDRTISPLGRRKPYFLAGALLGAIALCGLPHAHRLWTAFLLLWLLNGAINLSIAPYKSYVGDLLPPQQQTQGYAHQSLLQGLSAVIAAALPWLLHQLFQSSFQSQASALPLVVELSFYIGAVALVVTTLWTVVLTPESPEASPSSVKHVSWPAAMRPLAIVQFSTWLGMFCVFLYLPNAIVEQLWGDVLPGTLIYQVGMEWSGLCIALYNVVCIGCCMALPILARHLTLPQLHAGCLTCGAIGLVCLAQVHHQSLVLLCMVGLGIAWASMQSIPYALLMQDLPTDQSGWVMGVFNLTIVVPQLVVVGGLGWIVRVWFQNHSASVMLLGGICFAIAAISSVILLENQPTGSSPALLESDSDLDLR